MENYNEIDKYTAKILSNLEQASPPVDFTDKLMDKILVEKTESKKIESFGSKKFIIIFSALFIPFFLMAIFFPSGNFSLPGNFEPLNNVFSNLQIDFGQILKPIMQSLKGSTFLKVLPIVIIALIVFEQILLKISDFKKV